MIGILRARMVLQMPTIITSAPARSASSDQIRIPTLIIHAEDDPFIPFAPLRDPAVANNPYILLVDPKQGGHVAFVQAETNGDPDRFWAENRVVEFCELAREAGSAGILPANASAARELL